LFIDPDLDLTNPADLPRGPATDALPSRASSGCSELSSSLLLGAYSTESRRLLFSRARKRSRTEAGHSRPYLLSAGRTSSVRIERPLFLEAFHRLCPASCHERHRRLSFPAPTLKHGVYHTVATKGSLSSSTRTFCRRVLPRPCLVAGDPQARPGQYSVQE
jgi:hypothetical protein